MKRVLLIGLAFIPFAAWGQSSASFSVASGTFNSGGTPGNDSPASANYRISVAAIGEMVSAANLSSTSYSMAIGFVASNHPPNVLIFGDGFESADLSPWAPNDGLLKNRREDLIAPGKSELELLRGQDLKEGRS